MKIIIEHSRTKREIDGLFNITGSRQHLEHIARQINDNLKDESWSYASITIYPKPKTIMPNTDPKPWDS
jgi:hypothetical protein